MNWLKSILGCQAKNSSKQETTARRKPVHAQLGVEILEARELPAGLSALISGPTLMVPAMSAANMVNLRQDTSLISVTAANIRTSLTSGPLGTVMMPAWTPDVGMPANVSRAGTVQSLQNTLPILNSNPGAAQTLHLDFTASDSFSWTQDTGPGMSKTWKVQNAVFDTDGNANLFSSAEQNQIRSIWAAVAEDYAPFNINVTTSYSGAYGNNQALRVVIDGNGSWFTEDNSGTSNIGCYTSARDNVVFVFAHKFASHADFALAVANTASHEAGHGFGLLHDVNLSTKGEVTNQYNAGTTTWTPIMGDNLSNDRTTWSNGFADPAGVATRGSIVKVSSGKQPDEFRQDRFAELGRTIGFRADDHAGTETFGAAGKLLGDLYSWYTPSVGTTQMAAGVIENTSDTDTFSFDTQGGKANIYVSLPPFGAGNLDATLSIYSASMQLIGRSDPDNVLDASLNLQLAAGRYYVSVGSHGQYGDVGRYVVSMMLSSPPAIDRVPLITVGIPMESLTVVRRPIIIDPTPINRKIVLTPPAPVTLQASVIASSTFVVARDSVLLAKSSIFPDLFSLSRLRG